VEDNTFKLLSVKKKENRKLPIHNLDFYKIANKKYKIANTSSKIFSGREYLIYNSTGFVDHLLSIATHKQFDEKLSHFFCEDMRSYDLVFVNNDLENNVGKILNINSSIFLNQLTSNLNSLGIKYQLLSGTFKNKILIVERLIKTFKKRFN
jgi:hypothetical protein